MLNTISGKCQLQDKVVQLQQQLSHAEAAKDEALYELGHQRVWFDATQQEAINARQAEAQAYKTLDADRQEFEKVLY